MEVDVAHLIQFDEELANQMKLNPKTYLPLFEDAVKTLIKQSNVLEDSTLVPRCQVMLISRANPIPIRELDVIVLM